jgi:hypothetical protein
VPVAAEDAPVLLVTTEDAALETHARRQAARPVVLDSSSQALRDLRLRESNYRRLLGLADALTAALAVLVAVDGVGARPLRLLYLLVVPLMILADKLGGLYDNDELVLDRTTLKELPRLVNVASVVALLIWLMRHYLVTGTSDTFHLLMLWGLLIGGLVVTRAVARRVAERISPVERCMLVGGAGVFERLAGKLEHLSGVDLVGRTDPEIAMDHRALHELLVREQVHRLIIETGVAGPAATLDIIRMANMTGLRVSLLPTTLGAVGSSVVFDDIGGLVLMGVPHFGLSRSSLALKRAGGEARLARAGAVPPDPHGPRRDRIQDAQVPQHARRGRHAEGLVARAQRGRLRLSLQDRRRSAAYARRQADPPLRARRAAAAVQRAGRQHEPRGTAPARDR